MSIVPLPFHHRSNGRLIPVQTKGLGMSLDSTVGVAKIGTKSLRATVPEGIVAYLNIQAGDKLLWTMENDKDGERIVLVRKANVPPSFEKQSRKRR